MKLLEIKNNLVKLSYEDNETPILGRFIVLMAENINYVAQFVNLKADTVSKYAIAKLIFTFNTEGVVDNYNGSIPSMKSEVLDLNSDELLNLLPVETPVKIGMLAQQQDLLNLDISVFEHNLTVFAERETDKITFISNCVRQLFQMKEKTVIIDAINNFGDYPKIEFTKDFKLPLNAEMIDYLFEYELAEVDTRTKAVIQDIFYTVQLYINSLEFKFLPIDNFVEVVANQYKETQMPELALLKNKLLKYRDANIFANTKEEVLAFSEKLAEKNCSIISLNNINDSLQKEVIMFIHKTLETFDKYVYFFCSLNDDNSDKKLLKQIVNNNHVFTTLLVSSTYKYAKDLKSYADNIVVFAPQDFQHDFSAYNTFLNKLNIGECIVFGKLTQGIPFIVDMTDLNLDLTKDDVLGDKYQFVPVSENVEMMATEDVELSKTLENTDIPEKEEVIEDKMLPEPDEAFEEEQLPSVEETPQEIQGESLAPEFVEMQQETEEIQDEKVFEPLEYEQYEQKIVEEPEIANPAIVEPVANIFADADDELVEDVFSEFPPVENAQDEETIEENATLTEEDLDFIEDNHLEEEPLPETLDIEDEPYVEEPYIMEDNSQMVPVYPAQEQLPTGETDEDEIDFAQGDSVTHPRYGRGVIEKIIKYGNKTLCSIAFENVGRRLLDPSISEFTKL